MKNSTQRFPIQCALVEDDVRAPAVILDVKGEPGFPIVLTTSTVKLHVPDTPSFKALEFLSFLPEGALRTAMGYQNFSFDHQIPALKWRYREEFGFDGEDIITIYSNNHLLIDDISFSLKQMFPHYNFKKKEENMEKQFNVTVSQMRVNKFRVYIDLSLEGQVGVLHPGQWTLSLEENLLEARSACGSVLSVDSKILGGVAFLAASKFTHYPLKGWGWAIDSISLSGTLLKFSEKSELRFAIDLGANSNWEFKKHGDINYNQGTTIDVLPQHLPKIYIYAERGDTQEVPKQDTQHTIRVPGETHGVAYEAPPQPLITEKKVDIKDLVLVHTNKKKQFNELLRTIGEKMCYLSPGNLIWMLDSHVVETELQLLEGEHHKAMCPKDFIRVLENGFYYKKDFANTVIFFGPDDGSEPSGSCFVTESLYQKLVGGSLDKATGSSK